MNNNIYKVNYGIPYYLEFTYDAGQSYWVIQVEWSDMYAALNLDPSIDYDDRYDEKFRQMLLACGAPDWVADPIDTYPDDGGWITWGGAVTDDELVGWAIWHPQLAGRTDDLDGLRERYATWKIGLDFAE